MSSSRDYVLLAPNIKRGQRVIDDKLAEVLIPISSESMTFREARHLIPNLDALISQQIVVTCSQPIAYFYNEAFWLIVHGTAPYRDFDQHFAFEVQDTYFLNVLDTGTLRNIVDIGGHVGSFTLYIKHLCPQARVIVMEPEPGNFELLQLNLDGIDGVYFYNQAVSYSPDVIINRNNENSGAHVVMEREKYAASDPAAWSAQGFEVLNTSVKTTSVEALLAAHQFDYVDLMKLDCEGCEDDVLIHMQTETLRHVRYLVGEYHHTASEFVGIVGERVLNLFQLVIDTRGMVVPGYFLAVNYANPLRFTTQTTVSSSPVAPLTSTLHIDFRQQPPGIGWHGLETNGLGIPFRWMNATVATLELPVRVETDLLISIRVVGAIAPEMLAALKVNVNDIPLPMSEVDTEGTMTTYQIYVPQFITRLKPDSLLIELTLPYTRRPSDIHNSSDIRNLGVAVSWVTLDPVPESTVLNPLGAETSVEIDWLFAKLPHQGLLLDIYNGDNTHLRSLANYSNRLHVHCIGERVRPALLPRGATLYVQSLLGNTLTPQTYDDVAALTVLSQVGLGALSHELGPHEHALAVNEIHRLLKPGGMCLATVLVGNSGTTRTYRQYSPQDIHKLFAGWTLEITYWQGQGGQYREITEQEVITSINSNPMGSGKNVIAGIVAHTR